MPQDSASSVGFPLSLPFNQSVRAPSDHTSLHTPCTPLLLGQHGPRKRGPADFSLTPTPGCWGVGGCQMCHNRWDSEMTSGIALNSSSDSNLKAVLLMCAELKSCTISWGAHKCSDSRPPFQACKTGTGTTGLAADFLAGQWASLAPRQH